MRLTPPLTVVVAKATLVEELLVDSETLGASSRLEEKRSEIRPSCATSVEDLVSINLLHSMEKRNQNVFQIYRIELIKCLNTLYFGGFCPASFLKQS
ncbi:hypothetical protein L6452_26329 [Arctium lappa]|uniref:Uncharacterized protein n=1 Tax=Arctium lappa TaxID=4217 RepID=A0ACB9ADI5_ARCLA|nr:hypothetical protein L6452_26329 [Arctium lappa]